MGNLIPININTERLGSLSLRRVKNLVGHYIITTRTYLELELKVLETVNSYDIIYHYLDQLPERITTFIENRCPKEPKFSNVKDYYLLKVVELLKEKANNYNSMMGFGHRRINETLEQLAEKFSKKKS